MAGNLRGEMTEVIMPKMGDGMEEGTLLEWLKKDGDQVKSGEVIGTIQTDKATLELESPGAGVLSGILVKNGETVPVGHAIAALLKAGESLPSGWAKGEPVASGAATTKEAKQEAKTGNGVPSEPAPSVDHDPSDRVKASPLAKRIAEELGVDLASVKGTGPEGRIIEKDVRTAQPVGIKGSATPAAKVAPAAGDQTIQLNKLRQITAQRTAQSKQQVPHYYITVQVDAERMMKMREQFAEEESGKVSVNDFVLRACVLALQEMPVVNSAFQGQTLLQPGAIHLGMAVAIEDGLTVAVVKNAQGLSLRQLSDRSKELATKAKDNNLSLDELSGSTFTISNMGMLNVDEFIAIINQPNAAILAISSIKKQVVATGDDEIEIRRCMNISGSFDHRVVDGAVGAKFMNLVRSYLENPTRVL
jgi:pyruvate dehydrogenase E2 component (dihydrolipoamide acetyltransferase)